MDVSRWERAKQLFGSALEQEPAQRGAFLTEACRGDLSLLQEVESLLAAHQDAATTLVGTGLGESAAGKPACEDLIAGRHIGPYEVVRRIGQGGMAAVYLAVRADDQYKKRVAIKLIPPGLDSEELLRRLRNERQTLAALDHPHIVKLLDGGTTEDGLPYLVMDYVEGTPLDEYCDHHKLSIAERLQLFRKVCEAVQYAHQRLVIHRDLKPGNILVTADGTVKLLDFGIAKLLNPEAAATLVVTRTGQRAMTPEYASPEQVRGEPLTNATDVYSLGVVLYELLTGHRLYQLRSHSFAEIEHAICEEEPVEPSTIVTRPEQEILPDGTTKTTTAEEISRVRVADPRKLHSLLHGDLDAIVMTALRKEPQRRYSSVYEFSEDIRRQLEGLPIKARPQTLRYRAAKFLRRHREATAATLIFAVVIAGFGIAGGFYYRSHSAKPLTEKDTVVLADFENRTGDAVFDDALKQALAVELQQSPFLNILSDQKVTATLRRMGRSTNERITTDVGREICQRVAAKALLGGTISSMGSHYWIGLNAAACDTGDPLAEEEVEASRKEDVLKALSRASSRLRAKLGESLPSVQKFDVPIEVTTSSFDALKNYSVGLSVAHEKGDEASIPFLKRAIELDPNFPMAYARLSVTYHNLQQRAPALQYATKAYQLRDRASGRERLVISDGYFRARGELDKQSENCELWIANYPRDFTPHNNLGTNYLQTGQYEKAEAEYEVVLRLRPDAVIVYQNLVAVYLGLNRLQDAKAIIDQALARKLDSGNLRQNIYAMAFLRRDSAQMEQQVAWGAGKPGDEDPLLSMQSDTEAYYGRLEEARNLSRRAVRTALRADSKETAALWQVNAALREAELGDDARARPGVTKALALSSDRDVKFVAALTLARAGDTSRATALAKDLEKNYATDTVIRLYWLPTINAAIKLNGHNPPAALVDLETAAPYELGQAGDFINYLYPAYVRGQAYLLMHNGLAAAVEFQKLLNHPGIVLNFVTGVLAHLQLGRAYAMAGDTAKAKAAYQDFFTLWKDADPDIPILKQAKTEYAKLQ